MQVVVDRSVGRVIDVLDFSRGSLGANTEWVKITQFAINSPSIRHRCNLALCALVQVAVKAHSAAMGASCDDGLRQLATPNRYLVEYYKDLIFLYEMVFHCCQK